MKSSLVDSICTLFIVLFSYAAISKLMDYEAFSLQISKSPMLAGIADFITWSIPFLEIIISLLLIPDRTRKFGLYASFTLMLLFCWYILAITQFSEYIPCSCGGILEKLSWTQHFVFNSFFVVAGAVGIIRINSLGVSSENNQHLV